MKTTKQISIMMAVVLLSLSINSCDRCTGNSTDFTSETITLYVDTDKINETNIDSTCNFGQTNGVSNADYTTVVTFGDEITWVGISSSSPDTDIVKIKKIKYESGAEILTKKVNRNSWFSPKVRGKVNIKDRLDLTKENKEKYSIEFKVKGKTGRFIIDPKLQIGDTIS